MREVRYASFDSQAITRGEGDDPLIQFTGHAAVFNTPTVIGGMRYGFVERIADGAFDDVLNGDTKMLHNHDSNLLLARTTNGTLRLSTDKIGLANDADFAPTAFARDLAVLLERKDITQQSFAFTVGSDDWETLADDHPDYPGMESRVITSVNALYDTSTVTYPAYTETDAGLRVFSMPEQEVRGIIAQHRSDHDAAIAMRRMEESALQRHKLFAERWRTVAQPERYAR